MFARAFQRLTLLFRGSHAVGHTQNGSTKHEESSLVRTESYNRALDEGVDQSDAELDLTFDQAAVLRELDQDSDRRAGIFTNNRWRAPVTLEWNNLGFSVGERKILDNISGFARPGQVLALMGPSGAGKTTMLDMLAGRLLPNKVNKTEGSVRVNGEKRDFNSFRQLCAYVLQADNFFPELTVRETVNLSALLRLPREIPDEQKLQRVEQVCFGGFFFSCRAMLGE